MGIVSTMDLNGGSIDGTTIGAAAQSTAKVTSISASAGVTSTGGHISGSHKLQLAGDLVIQDTYKLTTAGALHIASMGANWTNVGRTVADMGIVSTMDLNGGSIDGTPIGAAAQSTIKATSMSGSTSLDVHGASVKMPNLADGAIVDGKSIVWSDGGLLKTEAIADVATLFAGTVANTALAAVDSVLVLDVASLPQQFHPIVAADEMFIFDDSSGTRQKIGPAALLSGSAPLLAEAAMTLADDYVLFLDGGANGMAKKEQWSDIVANLAGSGLTATNGVLSTDGAGTPNNLLDGETLTEGYNYVTASAADATYHLPNNPSVGDIIRIKVGNLAAGKIATLKTDASGDNTLDGLTKIIIESPYSALSFCYHVSGSWSIF